MSALQTNNQSETVVDDSAKNSCPDILIKSGSRLFLHNTQLPKGANNPRVFLTLDEYIMFTKLQRLEKGIYCPVLFLQEESNTQGQDMYRLRPDPNNLDAGSPLMAENDFGPTRPLRLIDATRENPPFNQGNYPSFDPHGFDQGIYTKLDERHEITNGAISDNPMDPNWGGVQYTQTSILSGKYADNEVGKPTMVPKVIQV